MKTSKKQNKGISLLLLSLFNMTEASTLIESSAYIENPLNVKGAFGEDEFEVDENPFSRNADVEKTEDEKTSKKSSKKSSTKSSTKASKKKAKEESLKKKLPKKTVEPISEKEMKPKSSKDAFLDLPEQIEEIEKLKLLFDKAKAERERLGSLTVQNEYDGHKKKTKSLPLAIGRKYGVFAKIFGLGWGLSAEEKKEFHMMVDDLKASKAYVEKHDKDVKYIDEVLKFYEKNYGILLSNLNGLVNQTDKKSAEEAGVEQDLIVRCQAAHDLADNDYGGSKIDGLIKPSLASRIQTSSEHDDASDEI